MNKINCILMVVIVVLNPVSSFGSDFSIEGSAGIFSPYVWRGLRISEKMTLQPSVTLSYKSVAANVWSNYDFDMEEINEVDYTLSYGLPIDTFDIEAGFCHYDIFDGLDSNEFYFSATMNVLLNPCLDVYADVDEGSGAFITAGISHSISLPGECSLRIGSTMSCILDNEYIAVDADGKEFTGPFTGEFDCSASIPLGAFVTIEPMIAYSFPLAKDAADAIERSSTDGASNQFWGGASVFVAF